jgi:hypothetical protein
MADSPELSVAALERLLNQKREKLQRLEAARIGMAEKLAALDGEIAALRGKGWSASNEPAAPAAQKAGKKAKPGRRMKRGENALPLREVVRGILQQHKAGLTLKELADEVLATGYQSSSNNFKNVLYQSIHNAKLVKLDKKTHKYRLLKTGGDSGEASGEASAS